MAVVNVEVLCFGALNGYTAKIMLVKAFLAWPSHIERLAIEILWTGANLKASSQILSRWSARLANALGYKSGRLCYCLPNGL